MRKPKPAHGGLDDANCPREFRKDYWKYTSNQQPTWIAIIGATAIIVSIACAVLMPYAM